MMDKVLELLRWERKYRETKTEAEIWAETQEWYRQQGLDPTPREHYNPLTGDSSTMPSEIRMVNRYLEYLFEHQNDSDSQKD